MLDSIKLHQFTKSRLVIKKDKTADLTKKSKDLKNKIKYFFIKR